MRTFVLDAAKLYTHVDGTYDYSHIVCVDEQAADGVRALLPSQADTTIMVANASGGGIPDPYELGIEGYRACLALLDTVMPAVVSEIMKPR